MFPIHLDLGFRQIHFYEGIYFIICILLGILLSRRRVGKEGIDLEKFDTFALLAIIGAIIGGRLSNFIFWNTDALLHRPWTFFFVWQGGISITGGIAGGILAGWLYTRKSKLPFWDMYAMIAPILLLAQGLGRIGCFLNGDAHGTPTDLPWGVQFRRYGIYLPTFKTETAYSSFPWTYSYENNLVTSDSTLSAPLHPTQLYEMLLDFLLLGGIVLLYRIVKKKGLSPKLIFFTHVGGYSFYRFLLEFIRADARGMSPLGMTYMQLTLVAIFVFSLVYNIILVTKKRPGNLAAK